MAGTTGGDDDGDGGANDGDAHGDAGASGAARR